MSTRDLYIDLLKRVLTDEIYAQKGDIGLEGLPFEMNRRRQGRDWPSRAHTMVGALRLQNVQDCVEAVLRDGVPGDFIETGVWRGGVAIFMRALLQAHADTTRRVWIADSFQGLPPPDPERYPVDHDSSLHEFEQLAVSRDEVMRNFSRYELLDDRVTFIEGWFRDTLPTCDVGQLAIMRLDGDMYESTYIALDSLYPKLSPGGFCIIDDYGAIPACAQAVHDFRNAHSITEELVSIDWTGVFWRRS